MRKPQKEIFLAACEDLNVKPSETVYIGDTISRDVSGSNNAKLAACFRIGSTLTTNADNGTKSPDTKYVITSLKDIIKLLKDTPFI
jgi:FMN phosphatase YigB (HAD superfamily)